MTLPKGALKGTLRKRHFGRARNETDEDPGVVAALLLNRLRLEP